MDCGTSGGVWGRERGYCLMIGGDDQAFAHAEPIFATIAPGVDAAPRTPGRDGEVAQSEKGYLHCGPCGAGHFVKMVHNGIEYGMMASLAEGLNILRNADIGNRVEKGDAETAPLSNPECYQYDFDIADVAEVWRRGSVVGSWLLDLTAIALHESPDLKEFSGRVSDSGEGRWTAIAAIDEGVPAPVLTTALQSRFASRRLDDFANKALSAMRKQFGGHAEKPGASRERVTESARYERHHDVAEGVVVVAGRGVPGVGQFDELGARHRGQEMPDAFRADDVGQLAADQQHRDRQVSAACSNFSVRSSGSSPGLVMNAGSQCQYQRPSRRRRFFFSPSGLRGLVR